MSADGTDPGLVIAVEVEVDEQLCQGYANCLDAAPEVFELGEDDIARPRARSYPSSRRGELEEAARRCPAKAIRVTDLDGPGARSGPGIPVGT